MMMSFFSGSGSRRRQGMTTRAAAGFVSVSVETAFFAPLAFGEGVGAGSAETRTTAR